MVPAAARRLAAAAEKAAAARASTFRFPLRPPVLVPAARRPHRLCPSFLSLRATRLRWRRCSQPTRPSSQSAAAVSARALPRALLVMSTLWQDGALTPLALCPAVKRPKRFSALLSVPPNPIRSKRRQRSAPAASPSPQHTLAERPALHSALLLLLLLGRTRTTPMPIRSPLPSQRWRQQMRPQHCQERLTASVRWRPQLRT